MKQHFGWMTTLLWVCLLMAVPARATMEAESPWPREINTAKGAVIIYQPQPEKLDGNQLKGRAAVSVEFKESTEPVFGAVWFEARLDTDRAERTAVIEDISITQIRFPNEDEQKSKQLKALLEKEIPKWQLPISLDRLMTTLGLAEKRSEAAQRINIVPPRILFVPEPAVLISIDGEPKLQKEEGSEISRVINTPFTILFMPSEKTYYLYADKDTWYTAGDIKGDWTITKKVPSEIAKRAPEVEPDSEKEEAAADEEAEGPPPKVIVVTEPAELISSNGKPEFTPISGTDLLYVSNTDSDVLFNIKTQQYFVLLSGRWYVSANLEGPWKHVPAEEVPADFEKIPEDSEMGTVLYAVPGTDVAKDAVLDAQIPQTATVDRKKAELKVEYDGNPKFEKIKGTRMTYAVNTATPVIRVDKKYYACDEAVWFVANGVAGPWKVATEVPDEIYTIPPECPIYHVTFVRIYEATPEVVYVGYTPGYTNTYVYNTTIVYGTGYWYPGWYGRYYYPRPATWGFHVRWNPWTGWGFGLSYCNGPFRFTIGGGGWYRGGWWGPGRYRGYRRGYRHGRRAGYRAGYQSGRSSAAQQNLYRNQRNKARTTTPPASAGNRGKAGAAKHRANNVYADRNGDVHRKTDKEGWEKKTKDGWKSEKDPPSRDQQKMDKQRQSKKKETRQTQTQKQKPRQQQTQQLNRDHQARQRGDQRARSHNRSRSHSGGRSGGRGGGGRR
ncbi:carbohydrate-binding family V/XII [Thermodesulfobacteriota bacterium]